MAKHAADGPDRGWSWVIAFAACFNSLILAGIFRTSGVLFVAFIDEFGVTREEASWPVVLCVSVLNLTAIGHGLATTLMPIIINEYFLNHRATANGIANSGSCFGSILFPLLFEHFINIYGLSGCFLLTGGIVLQLAIPAALMRPPSWLHAHKSVANTKRRNKISNPEYVTEKLYSCREFSGYDAVVKSIESRNSQQKLKAENGSLTCQTIEKNNENSKREGGCSFSNNKSEQYLRYSDPQKQGIMSDGKETFKNSLLDNEESVLHRKETELHKSLRELEECYDIFENVWKSSVQCLSEYKPFVAIDASDAENLSFKSNRELHINEQNENFKLCDETKISAAQESNPKEADNLNYSSHIVENQHTNVRKPESFRNLLENKDHIHCAHDVSTITCELKQENESIRDTKESEFSKQPMTILKSFHNVLTSYMFYVIAITNVSFYFLYHMYVVIIVDFSLDRGTPDKDTKYVLFGFAIPDLIGRLCLGWVTDLNFLRRSHFVMCCMILIGINFFGFPIVNGYIWLVFVSCLYGLLLGCTMVVFPILLVDYLGMEIQAVAMGCMCFLNGLASLTRPFIIGYFRDKIGSYSSIFFILGSISLVSSILWFLEKCFDKTKIGNT